MYDLFELFDLDPKASFRNTGEQIDGAFSLEGTDYLFEAKWQQELVNAAALDAFASKVRRKLENTLGVFLSINGYSQDGVAAHSAGGAVIILMDGADLMAVLEERIDFVSLLLRKKRHASQTGSIYMPVHEILR
jgi:restriction endonuclease Mrr